MVFAGAFSQYEPCGDLAVAGALSQQFENIQTLNGNGAALGLFQPLHAGERGRFARAVGPIRPRQLTDEKMASTKDTS